jgi:hypothetical protein
MMPDDLAGFHRRTGATTVEQPQPPEPAARAAAPAARLRIWHLALLVLFVAVAIVNIQDQGRTEPALIALAAAGFVAYGVLGWLGWRLARRFEARLGATAILVLYLAAMAGLFLVATVIYVALEILYLGGRF